MFQGATGGAGHLCAACRLEPRPWERLLFHGPYQGLLRRLVLDYKFHGRLGALRLLRGLARETWLRAAAATQAGPQPPGAPASPAPPALPDVVVPVPLHQRRLLHRGFNQSLELARGLGTLLERPVPLAALTRVRHTVPQMTLDAARRRDNVRGAFAADATALAGRRVLLVDDVMTTGGTLEECARTLRRAGAAGVVVLVLARTPGGR
jgi:ComF family protein